MGALNARTYFAGRGPRALHSQSYRDGYNIVHSRSGSFTNTDREQTRQATASGFWTAKSMFALVERGQSPQPASVNDWIGLRRRHARRPRSGAVVSTDSVFVRNCPRCGRYIRDFDMTGREDSRGQRWCVEHLPPGEGVK